MNDAVQVGKIVRQLRVERQITQAELAERMGWQQPAVCVFEKGRRKVLDVKDVQKLTNIFNVSPEQLLYNDVQEDTVPEESSTNQFISRIIDQIAQLNSRQQERMWRIVAEIVAAWS